jgi:hypothetical protein
MLTEDKILSVMAKTQDAYSYDRYGYVAWRKAIVNLDSWGYTEKQIVEILKHKYMRWAADSFMTVVDLPNGEQIFCCTGDEIIKYAKQYRGLSDFRLRKKSSE